MLTHFSNYLTQPYLNFTFLGLSWEVHSYFYVYDVKFMYPLCLFLDRREFNTTPGSDLLTQTLTQGYNNFPH
jgi:hypothetical protein